MHANCALQCRVFHMHWLAQAPAIALYVLLTLAARCDHSRLCHREENSLGCSLEVADSGMQAQEARLKMGPSSGSELLVPVTSA